MTHTHWCWWNSSCLKHRQRWTQGYKKIKRKEKQGRPTGSWRGTVEKDMKKAGMSWNKISQLVQDWDAWRRFVGAYSCRQGEESWWSLFIGCLTSQQQASVSQGQICSDTFTCCHTEIEVEDQTFYLTQSQYTDTGLTSPSADPISPGAWQGSHWSANF